MIHGTDIARPLRSRRPRRAWPWTNVVACLLATAVAAGSPLHGQERSPELVYEREMKDPTTAMALEALLPFVGHAYAGDASRGLIPGLLTIGGLGSAFLGVIVWAEEDEDCGGTVCASESVTALLVGGLVAAGVGRVWGALTAAGTANRYNRELRESLFGNNVGVSLRPGPGQRVALAVSVRGP